VPRLIIEHNIYGVDIDPRAAQIATLALWLRAQRSWHDAGVKAKDRPRIGQGHVVAAIAPPAERELRQSFAQQLDELDALLFDKTLVLLKNLPEMGVLLQVERELPHLIMQVYGGKGSGLFAAQEQETWQHAEQRLRIALEAFAHAARNTYQGRLFAQDALQGLRLIDLCREVFDVVVMNPPFGAPPPSYKKIDSSASIVNLYTAFVDRALDMGARYIGAITDRTFVVQSTFESFRMSLIDSSAPITALADLGWGVLDANVQVCAYTMTPDTSDICAFADVKEDIEKGELIKCNSEKWGYKSLSTFKNLPRTVLAYSIPNKILDLYEKWERLEHIADLPRGLGSNKAERTFRSWVEIPNVSENGVLRWASLANGGDFSPFWREDLGLTEWRSKKGFLWTSMSSSDGWRVYDQSAIDQYFIKGLSFPKQSSHFNVAILPSDYVPTREGKAILVHSDVDAIPLVGVLNSGLIGAIVRDTCGLHKQGRSISSIPVPPLDSDQKKRLGHLVGSLINYVKNSYTHDEVSRHFTLPYSLVNTENYLSEDDLTIILNEIDEIVLSKIDKDD
ncbi:hypothetical protein FJZ55_09900, partial [Candidatus Woesearchaeota archaeon]|nr:hypothetical protein [Candidatus Woesearchaeota archaeon]